MPASGSAGDVVCGRAACVAIDGGDVLAGVAVGTGGDVVASSSLSYKALAKLSTKYPGYPCISMLPQKTKKRLAHVAAGQHCLRKDRCTQMRAAMQGRSLRNTMQHTQMALHCIWLQKETHTPQHT